jgi:hypothetical protein
MNLSYDIVFQTKVDKNTQHYTGHAHHYFGLYKIESYLTISLLLKVISISVNTHALLTIFLASPYILHIVRD